MARRSSSPLLGLVPAGVGLAYLFYYVIEGHKQPPVHPGTPPPG